MTGCTCDPLAIALAEQVRAPQPHGAQCPSSPPESPARPPIALNDDESLKSIIMGSLADMHAEDRAAKGVDLINNVLNNR